MKKLENRQKARRKAGLSETKAIPVFNVQENTAAEYGN
jgi:hypothetical protein